MNSPRLRPYHNPENVDESRVPKGWRLRYADEMTAIVSNAKFPTSDGWRFSDHGVCKYFSYIVPVA